MDLSEGLQYFGMQNARFTYNNSMKVEEVPLLKACSVICKYEGKPYYSGACNNCCTLTTKSQPIQRCAGCHLVSYCSRNCQKNDWKKHKIFCKTFKVKNGKNALMLDEETRDDPKKWCEALENLEEKAYAKCMEKNEFLESVFSSFSRACNWCKKAQQDKLFDCSCCSVAYCCKAHEQADKLHKEFCEELGMFPIIDYIMIKEKTLKLPCILKNTVRTIFEPITKNHFNEMKIKMSQEFEGDHNGEFALIPPTSLSRFDAMFSIQTNHLAFPLTILFSLQEFGVGEVGKPIQTLSSLDIHIVTFQPVFDSSVWEYFMHLLPALMELNITFITPKVDREFLDYQGISLERCEDCKSKGRIINYSVHRNHYHMFFSSDEYTEPDVVAVFGHISPAIMYTEDELEHPMMSYRNMTYSNDTLLILTDAALPSLLMGVHHVSTARSTLKQVLPPQGNPMAGLLGIRGIDFLPIMNFKNFFCCLRNS
ncbi:unnamed protein product [Meganyctiphanes norvegica]|uniref:MYND-type domain-containing protein n=1 Tax=Meganyctiphanes norvegica TaxID=48144 RepID=A0AAV2S1Q7_MEGNR